jgi:hypothetical protein
LDLPVQTNLFLEQLVVAYVAKKFFFYETRRFVTMSQEPATVPCLEPDKSATYTVVFWVIVPCSLVAVYQRFGGIYCRHLQG